MRQSLIKSRHPSNSILSMEEIIARAPAAFATSKASHLTDRYAALHTSDIIPVMADHGYFPVQAAQTRARKGSDGDHRHHLLSFAKIDDLPRSDRPEITLFNSHDGSGAVRLFAGIYRMICSNGIVIGDGSSTRVYHTERQLNGFEDMLRQTIQNVPKVLETMERMKSVQLSIRHAELMADKALSLRWKPLEPMPGEERRGNGVYYTGATIDDVVRARREEDAGVDAYRLFNRIQENVLRGNAFVRSITTKHPEGVTRKARPISSVKEHTTINEKLWNIVEEYV